MRRRVPVRRADRPDRRGLTGAGPTLTGAGPTLMGTRPTLPGSRPTLPGDRAESAGRGGLLTLACGLRRTAFALTGQRGRRRPGRRTPGPYA